MSSSTFLEKVEILPDRLYFCTVPHKNPAVNENGHPSYAIQSPNPQFIYFCTDASLTYTSFFADFGPLNIGLTYKFCEQLDTYLTQSKVEQRPVIYYCSQHPHFRANSAVLICAYLIFVMGMTVEQAYAPFIGISPRLISSRDAAFCINSYPIFPLDCAKAFYRASQLNHFNYDTFDVQKHDQLAKLEHGDVSWLVPGKFIAFSGPVAQRREVGRGLYALSPEAYVPLFHSLGVSCVIRFNKKCYDKNIFTRGGIRHVDLFYEDGGNPTDDILQSFLRTCEQETGAIAVHCKAGLGRTGTNIAAYMMKHYGYTAREASAWCRVCRPGSVVGPQQQYLETKQDQMWSEGREYRRGRGGAAGANVRLSAGRQRSGQSSGAAPTRKKRPQKSFDTVEESVTATLLRRIQQGLEQEYSTLSKDCAGEKVVGLRGEDTCGSGGAGGGGGQGTKRSDSNSAKRLLPKKSDLVDEGVMAVPRPSTTENGRHRKSAERGSSKQQALLSASGSHVTPILRQNSGSAVSTSGSGSRRPVVSERRPNTSAGVTTHRAQLAQHPTGPSSNGSSTKSTKSNNSGGISSNLGHTSSPLRSGGGLKHMSGHSSKVSSSSSRPGAVSRGGTRSTNKRV